MMEKEYFKDPNSIRNKSCCLICNRRLKRKTISIPSSCLSVTEILCNLWGIPLPPITSGNCEDESWTNFMFCKQCCEKIRRISKVYSQIITLRESFHELQKEVENSIKTTLTLIDNIKDPHASTRPINVLRHTILQGTKTFQEIYLPYYGQDDTTASSIQHTQLTQSTNANTCDTEESEICNHITNKYSTSNAYDRQQQPEINTSETEIVGFPQITTDEVEDSVHAIDHMESEPLPVVDMAGQETSKRFNCTKCRYTFKDEIGRNAHWRKHHEGNDYPYVCSNSDCGKQFKTRRQFLVHMLGHKKETPFICEHCGKGFRMEKLLTFHLQNKHIGGRKYHCSHLNCKKEFSTQSKLNVHKLTHTQQWPATCKVCSKGFANKSSLNNHMIKHSELNPWECKVCGKFFSSVSVLNSHQALHSYQFKYPCSICPSGAPSKSALDRHLLSHSSDKKFKCSVCGNEFKYKRSLQKHLKAHSGKKNFQCNLCNKAFQDKYKLIRHTKIHEGNKPFECSICEKQFYTKDYLKTHMKHHEKQAAKKQEKNSKPKKIKKVKKGGASDESLLLPEPIVPLEMIPSMDQLHYSKSSAMADLGSRDLFSSGDMFQFGYQDV